MGLDTKVPPYFHFCHVLMKRLQKQEFLSELAKGAKN